MDAALQATMGDMASPVAWRLHPELTILSRPHGEVQVGYGEQALILPASITPLLRSLDGRSSPANLAHRSGLPVEQITKVLAALRRRGLLVDASAAPAPPIMIKVIGAGRFADDLSALGRASGLSVQQERYRRRRSLPRLSEARSTSPSENARPPRRHSLDAGPIVVIALGSAESDRGVSAQVHAHGSTHLVIDQTTRWVRVGPLVIPGATPCLRCLDLHRVDADPDWAWVAADLARTTSEPGPALRAWAGGHAVTQVRALIDGQIPTTIGGSVELGPDSWLPVERHFGVHPACDCNAPATFPPRAAAA